MELAPRRDGRIVLRDPPPGLDPREELSVRAARLLRERTGARAGADIRLVKRIPAGAGLGGASSDAATTLAVLNRLWRTGLDTRALAALALELGADVPVFVHGRSGWAEGTGERLRPLGLPARWYLVVHPRVAVSTASVFADPGLTRDSPLLKIAPFLAGRSSLDLDPLLAAAGNDCEPAVRRRHGAVGAVIDWLRGRVERTEWARMTGTGAAAFGIFPGEAHARRAAREVPAGWDRFVARGVDESPLPARLARPGGAAGGGRPATPGV